MLFGRFCERAYLYGTFGKPGRNWLHCQTNSILIRLYEICQCELDVPSHKLWLDRTHAGKESRWRREVEHVGICWLLISLWLLVTVVYCRTVPELVTVGLFTPSNLQTWQLGSGMACALLQMEISTEQVTGMVQP